MLAAGRYVDHLLFPSSPRRENVVKGAAEQTDDRVELSIPDCHLPGKIAFDKQRRLVTLALTTGAGDVGSNRPRRRRL